MNPASIEPENKKARGNKKILIGLFILVVLAIVLAIFLFVNRATPKKVFETSLAKIFETVNKNENEKIKTISGKFEFNVDINSPIYFDFYDIINDLDLAVDYNVDYENNKMNINVDSFYKDKDLININMYTEDEKGYIFLKDLYDKYIEIPIEDYKEMFNSKDFTEDAKTIMNQVENAIDKSLKNEYFSSKKTKLTINGKETTVTENILNLNEKNQKSLYKDIFTELNNDEFLETLSHINNEDKDVLKEEFEELLNSDLSVTDDYIISIYTKDIANQFVGFKMEENNKEILTITKEDDDTYKFVIDDFEGTVKVTEENDEYNLEISFDVETITLKLNMIYSYKLNEEFEDVDVSNSIPYESLTEDDMEDITDKFLNNEAIQELIEIFDNTFGSLTDSTFY